MDPKIASTYLQTAIGPLKIVGSDAGIQEVVFAENLPETTEIPECLQAATHQLKAYFEGSRNHFELPLNPQGTAFQKKVWRVLENIPFGQTVSYQDIANTLGDPKVIRAAASANGKNPIAIIIPCHRVIGSDGSLTGYAGGLHRKQWLLEHESPYKQQRLF